MYHLLFLFFLFFNSFDMSWENYLINYSSKNMDQIMLYLSFKPYQCPPIILKTKSDYLDIYQAQYGSFTSCLLPFMFLLSFSPRSPVDFYSSHTIYAFLPHWLCFFYSLGLECCLSQLHIYIQLIPAHKLVIHADDAS